MTAVRLVYQLIRSVAELESLPDGTIVMMDPETTTTPVLWGRVGDFWASLDPLAYPGQRDEESSLELFQRTITLARIRKLALVWTPPHAA